MEITFLLVQILIIFLVIVGFILISAILYNFFKPKQTITSTENFNNLSSVITSLLNPSGIITSVPPTSNTPNSMQKNTIMSTNQEEHNTTMPVVIPSNQEEEHPNTTLPVPANQEEEHSNTTLPIPANQEEHTQEILPVPPVSEEEYKCMYGTTKQKYQKYEDILLPSSLNPYIGRDFVAYKGKYFDKNYVSKRPGAIACQVDNSINWQSQNYDASQTNIISSCAYTLDNTSNDPYVWTKSQCVNQCSNLADIE